VLRGRADILPLLAPQIHGAFMEVAAGELHGIVRHREGAGHASCRSHESLPAESPCAPPGRLGQRCTGWRDRRGQPLAVHEVKLNGECVGSAHEHLRSVTRRIVASLYRVLSVALYRRLRPRLEGEFPRLDVCVEDDGAEAAEREQTIGWAVYADTVNLYRDVGGIGQRYEVRVPTALGPEREWLQIPHGDMVRMGQPEWSARGDVSALAPRGTEPAYFNDASSNGPNSLPSA
jgi:hypothetical protein